MNRRPSRRCRGRPGRTWKAAASLLAALTLSLPAAAQDIPSEVLVTPAGLAWIAAEARLLGTYAGPRPPDLEARLRALRLQMIAQCQDELNRSGTCPESVTLTLLRPLVSSLNEGHTRVVEQNEAATYGLVLVDVREGPRNVVRIADARRVRTQVGTTQVGAVVLRGDEVMTVNGVAVKDAQTAFHGISGPVTLKVRRDGRSTGSRSCPSRIPHPSPRQRSAGSRSFRC